MYIRPFSYFYICQESKKKSTNVEKVVNTLTSDSVLSWETADTVYASVSEKAEKRESKEKLSQQSENSNTVHDVVEQMPSFPGGQSALMQWLSNNIKYPTVAEENGVQGRVVCTFVVERDGSITNVQVVRGVDPSLDKEAVRVLRAMPKWNPGTQNGTPVRVEYTVPVTFSMG